MWILNVKINRNLLNTAVQEMKDTNTRINPTFLLHLRYMNLRQRKYENENRMLGQRSEAEQGTHQQRRDMIHGRVPVVTFDLYNELHETFGVIY
jgi:hypothetical protein